MRRIIHKDIQLMFVKKRLKHGRESNRASLIKQLISGEIVLMRVSKPKANTLIIYCDVFVRNCQFFMTFTAYIAVITNSLTYVVFHKVMTFIRRGG